jgi:hypothetical protein
LLYGKINRMPTEIYKIGTIHTIGGQAIEIIPLKIKYLRQFMDVFANIKNLVSEEDVLGSLAECARISMLQYCPDLSNTIEDIEDNFDLYNIYELMNYAAGIKLNDNSNESIVEQINSEENQNITWDNLDLAKLETEAFLLGIWKNYDELESSISIQELMSVIASKRELDYQEKKFLAALQGVNLDEASEKEDGKQRGQKEWEDLKARVFSRGQTNDSNDVLALQGPNAQKYGFGIGMGLDYEVVKG